VCLCLCLCLSLSVSLSVSLSLSLSFSLSLSLCVNRFVIPRGERFKSAASGNGNGNTNGQATAVHSAAVDQAEAQPQVAMDHSQPQVQPQVQQSQPESQATEPQPQVPPTEPQSTTTEVSPPTSQPQPQPQPAEQRPSGRRAKRKKPLREDKRLCKFVQKGEECPYQDKCKYVHDQEVYLQSKLEGLEGQCPSWRKQGGLCRSGIACRFAASHTPMTAEEIQAEKVTNDLLATEEKNVLVYDVRRQLRRKEYLFPHAQAFCTELDRVEAADENGNLEPPVIRPVGCIADAERKKIDWHNKVYLAPLTTAGNLPFRRLCKCLGADITCGEMAVAQKLLEGQASEWALVRRHVEEDVFGVQLCGNRPEILARCCELLSNETDVDFIDLNCGCPIDLIFRQGCGSALMAKPHRLNKLLQGMYCGASVPITVKMRTGIYDGKPTAHNLMPSLRNCGISAITIHGRSREQRYSRLADWDYIAQCVKMMPDFPIFGNGDIMSFREAEALKAHSGVTGVMVARGALHKPWVFTEIKEQRDWDISATERLDLIKTYVKNGLEHWGSDLQGVELTRSFLLEWLSFAHRYIPVGLLEVLPQRINEKPPPYKGRNELETLLSSSEPNDWVKISEMVLGPTPPNYKFTAKHKSNAYTGESMTQAEG